MVSLHLLIFLTQVSHGELIRVSQTISLALSQFFRALPLTQVLNLFSWLMVSSHLYGVGSCRLDASLSLSNVFYVPTLSHNLLSISKLTSDSNRIVHFFANSCLFQDRHSGMTIGRAKAVAGLYYFVRDSLTSGSCNAVSGSLSRHHLVLLNQRLGHPSFPYLKRFFSSLFRYSDSFHCEVCILAKHMRVPFPVHSFVESRPFALFHSDVWGPSRIVSLSN